jgi:hypothetical protein
MEQQLFLVKGFGVSKVVNINVLEIEIGDHKQIHLEKSLLQSFSQLHNGCTQGCDIFVHSAAPWLTG